MITFYSQQRKFKVTKEIKEMIKKVVSDALKEESMVMPVAVDITFTNNLKIRLLNNEYRKKDKPTDILSFPMYTRRQIGKLDPKDFSRRNKLILGDLVISLEKVSEQAMEYGHSFERELCYLVVHGMLHLMGYDHMKKADKQEMREKEEKVLEQLKFKRIL
jgi:probable rRNA maturation factor